MILSQNVLILVEVEHDFTIEDDNNTPMIMYGKSKKDAIMQLANKIRIFGLLPVRKPLQLLTTFFLCYNPLRI